MINNLSQVIKLMIQGLSSLPEYVKIISPFIFLCIFIPFIKEIMRNTAYCINGLRRYKFYARMKYILSDMNIRAIFIFCITAAVITDIPKVVFDKILPSDERYLQSTLQFTMGLTALISLSISFINSFVKDNDNDTYLMSNRSKILLNEHIGFQLIQSKTFGIALTLLYILPISSTVKMPSLIAKSGLLKFDTKSPLFYLWTSLYCFCVLCLLLTVNGCLSLLWIRGDSSKIAQQYAEYQIEKAYKNNYVYHYSQYIKTGQTNPIDRFARKFLTTSDQVTYWNIVLSEIRYFNLYNLFSAKSPWQSTKTISKKIANLRDYTLSKWRLFDSMMSSALEQSEDTEVTKILVLSKVERNADLQLWLDICSKHPTQCKDLIYGHPLPVDRNHINFFHGDTTNRINQMALFVTTAANRIVTMSDNIEEAIEAVQTTNSTLYDYTEDEKTCQELRANTLRLITDILTNHSWENAHEASRWIDRLPSELFGTALEQCLLQIAQNNRSPIIVEAIFDNLPSKGILCDAIFQCAHDMRTHSSERQIATFYRQYYNHLNVITYDMLSTDIDNTVSYIGNYIFNTRISHFFKADDVAYVIKSMNDDTPITINTIRNMDRIEFGFINFLLLYSIVASESQVMRNLSFTISSRQDSDYAHSALDSLDTFQENNPMLIHDLICRAQNKLHIAIKQYEDEPEENDLPHV